MKKIRKSAARNQIEIDRQLKLIKEQSERIADLKRQNNDLVVLLETYREKEKEIADAFLYANKKSAELLSDAKVKYALECERIKSFRKKWITAAKSGTLTRDIAATESVLRACQADMENMLATDLCEIDYLEERDRLNDEPKLNYSAIIEEEKGKAQEKVKIKSSPRDAKKCMEELTDEELDDLLQQI